MPRMSESISFDTAPLIWGVRGESDRGHEHNIQRTQEYIDYLRRCGNQVMVTSPVLSEYLIGANATELHELEILRRGFQLPGLDVPAAILAAELQRGNRIRDIQDEFSLSRECVKADAMIIAISIINHASKIFTNNERHFRPLAQGRIQIIGIDDLPQDPPSEETRLLFDGNEDEDEF